MSGNRAQDQRNTHNTQNPCFSHLGGYSLEHQRHLSETTG